jgi:hypothetical protein
MSKNQLSLLDDKKTLSIDKKRGRPARKLTPNQAMDVIEHFKKQSIDDSHYPSSSEKALHDFCSPFPSSLILKEEGEAICAQYLAKIAKAEENNQVANSTDLWFVEHTRKSMIELTPAQLDELRQLCSGLSGSEWRKSSNAIRARRKRKKDGSWSYKNLTIKCDTHDALNKLKSSGSIAPKEASWDEFFYALLKRSKTLSKFDQLVVDNAVISKKLKDELDLLFDSNEVHITRWMNTDIPALMGKTPHDILRKEDGENIVLDCLNKLKRGDF